MLRGSVNAAVHCLPGPKPSNRTHTLPQQSASKSHRIEGALCQTTLSILTMSPLSILRGCPPNAPRATQHQPYMTQHIVNETSRLLVSEGNLRRGPAYVSHLKTVWWPIDRLIQSTLSTRGKLLGETTTVNSDRNLLQRWLWRQIDPVQKVNLGTHPWTRVVVWLRFTLWPNKETPVEKRQQGDSCLEGARVLWL